MEKWLRELTDEYLQAASGLKDSDVKGFEQLATWMRDRFAAHGLKTLVQQKNLMSKVRKVLKEQFPEDHLALQSMNFSEAEWVEINHAIAQKAATQNENQVILSPETVNAMVARAANLLTSRAWAEVAAGLALLTGRRSTEILKTAVFTPKTEFSVVFTGALKRAGEATELSFEIPTLVKAEYILTALQKIRSALPTEHLTEAQVNQFANDVSAACNQHFADLVPPPKDRDNLYTHLFRKLYATIATYFYCPPDVDEAEFRAEIQGHFSGHESLSRAARRTIASDRHYRAYCIQDAQGNMRKGIHLNWQGVEVLEAFRKSVAIDGGTESRIENSTEDPMMEASTPTGVLPEVSQKPRKRLLKRPEIPADLLERLSALMAQNGYKGSYADMFEALLNMVTSLRSQLQVEREKNQSGLSTVHWFTQEIDQLRSRIAALEKENQTLRSAQASLSTLAEMRAENARLKADLVAVNARLSSIQSLIAGSAPTPLETKPPAALTPASASGGSLPIETHPPTSVAPTSLPHLATASAISLDAGALSFDRNPDAHDVPLDPDVERALKAIVAYNTSVSSHAERWAISIPVMKALLRQVGKATQPKIEAVLAAYSTAIDKHHRQFTLGERHNRVHKGHSISEVIKL